MRLDVRRAEGIKQGQEFIGNRTRVKVVKNKVAPPFKQAEFDIMYGEGVSKLSCVLDMAVDLDIVDKSGAWFSYGGTRLGQGKENAKKTIAETPGMQEELEQKVRDKLMNSENADDKEKNDAKDAKSKDAKDAAANHAAAEAPAAADA